MISIGFRPNPSSCLETRVPWDTTLECGTIKGYAIALAADSVGYVWSWCQWTVTLPCVTDRLGLEVFVLDKCEWIGTAGEVTYGGRERPMEQYITPYKVIRVICVCKPTYIIIPLWLKRFSSLFKYTYLHGGDTC
jgi:hypothetical protein